MLPLRRCLLYVPSSSARMLAKSSAVPADSLVYDLEDSVPCAKKAEARSNLAAHLRTPSHTTPRRPERLVRVNDLGTSFAADDLNFAVRPPAFRPRVCRSSYRCAFQALTRARRRHRVAESGDGGAYPLPLGCDRTQPGNGRVAAAEEEVDPGVHRESPCRCQLEGDLRGWGEAGVSGWAYCEFPSSSRRCRVCVVCCGAPGKTRGL